MFIGRYQLGQSVPIAVQTEGAPGKPELSDDVPVADLFTAAGALVLSKRLPIVDRFGVTGWFLLPVFLDETFEEGNYLVNVHWADDGDARAKTYRFEIVPGGDTDGAVVAMHAYDRPHGKFLVQQLDSGRIVAGRNPRL